MVVVWFKRDLRITDHEPLAQALASGKKVLLLYSFEPLWTQDPHYAPRHFNFIKESLRDLQKQLRPLGTKILIVQEDIISTLTKIHETSPVTEIHSHQETGLMVTYNRDKAVSEWCGQRQIIWKEYVCNGVFRGLKNRRNWKEQWGTFMNRAILPPVWETAHCFSPLEVDTVLQPLFKKVDLTTPEDGPFQKGGPSSAKKYLKTFLSGRIHGYNAHYPNPSNSRRHSSRLSPYLAWGNISTREVWQYAHLHKKRFKDTRNLAAFLSRLRWQAHFIQKFEMEVQMQFRSINMGYQELGKEVKPDWQNAWKTGNTGIPMVDAAMRCLLATGFVNFRLRALLASFFTHLMWQPWQDCAEHLAQCFLDFEPGIHYPQLNMQSGETGIHVIRIYNPIKNGKVHDPKGRFIRQWIPALREIPNAYLHEPWKMPPMERQFLNFELGRDYPEPMLDVEKMWAFSSDILWNLRKKTVVRQEGQRILKKHTLPGRPVWEAISKS